MNQEFLENEKFSSENLGREDKTISDPFYEIKQVIPKKKFFKYMNPKMDKSRLQVREEKKRQFVDFRESKQLGKLCLVHNSTQYLQVTIKTRATKISLRKTFTKLKKLERLSIDFEEPERQTSLSDLGKSLKYLKELEHISINFSDCENLREKKIMDLVQNLGSLRMLQNVSFNFKSCYRLRDEGIIYLGEQLSSLKWLRHISLAFDDCQELTDQGVLGLGKHLSSLKTLKHLSIDFFDCQNLTDQSVIGIGEHLSSLENLQNIYLSFAMCGNPTEQGILGLAKYLSSVKSLQHITLAFTYSRELLDQYPFELGNIGKTARSPKLSEHTSLDFTYCYRMHYHGKVYLEFSFSREN